MFYVCRMRTLPGSAAHLTRPLTRKLTRKLTRHLAAHLARNLVVLGILSASATAPAVLAQAGAAGASATHENLPALGEAEEVSAGHLGLEGPLSWPGDHGRGAGILFSDVSAQKILFFDPARAQTRVVDPASGGANGLALRDGYVYRCEGANRRIARSAIRLTEDGTPELLPSTPVVETVPGGRPHFTNDLIVAGGALLFTDPVYGPRPEGGPDVEGVYVAPLHADKPAAPAGLLVGDLTRPNGITVSADGRWLYVADEGARALFRFEVHAGVGAALPTLGERTLFADVAPFGNPDGLVTDRAGRVYVALFETGRLLVLSPAGVPLALTPAGERTSNVCLDHDQRHAYVTAGGSLLRFAVDVDRPADEAPIVADAP